MLQENYLRAAKADGSYGLKVNIKGMKSRQDCRVFG